MIFSITQLPPVIVSLIYSDGARDAFLITFFVTIATGMFLWLPVYKSRKELRLRDGFIVVVAFWTVLGLFGSLPLILSEHVTISITDSIFESISGLTTTGATVITNIESLPKSILYYRQQLQWLGGMGIVVLAVAIMPMLGIGGMQLYRAETPGPMKDSKLTPRLTETAKALWYIYLTLTILCGLGYWLAGMTVFDAVAHSFSTVSIGGFSTHDNSMAYFIDKPLIEVTAIIFMFISGINFALHFTSWRSRSIKAYLMDAEFKTYLSLMLITIVIATSYLFYMDHFPTTNQTILNSIFQVVSIGTTTGFTTQEYHLWPGFLPVMLLFLSFVGGCAGSTGGGMKVIRFLLLFKQGKREIMRVIHPNAILTIKIGGKPLQTRVIESVWGFFSVYVAIFSIMLLMLMALGLDQVTAFSAVAACLNNLGPGLNEVGLNYASLDDSAKWILCFAMLLGRLEIFTLLVLLTPAFWRR
ncbi:Trk potassium uptake system protein TrkH [hydrothermal vent metagenome]|uniref:Trk potassium uptake system protein TrkH n=1 Tax=hydrothermal vent metagenome TaxID=652676 RepID=A0A3B1AJ03_9ZZZZ